MSQYPSNYFLYFCQSLRIKRNNKIWGRMNERIPCQWTPAFSTSMRFMALPASETCLIKDRTVTRVKLYRIVYVFQSCSVMRTLRSTTILKESFNNLHVGSLQVLRPPSTADQTITSTLYLYFKYRPIQKFGFFWSTFLHRWISAILGTVSAFPSGINGNCNTPCPST